MPAYTKRELSSLRNYSVVKSNDMVLKSRYSLSLQEQRIILFLVSKIKMEDTELTEYPFSIHEFGAICGIDVSSGKAYKELKEALKNMADKSFWGIINGQGTESLLRWISTVRINPKDGTILLKLHEDMMPFLLQLKGKYLDYKLYYVLAMKSMYGIRMYELLKTRHNMKATTFEKKKEKVFIIEFETIELKRILSVENYKQYNDFKRRILEPAKQDINEYSDLMMEYEPIKEGRTFKAIRFFVRYKKIVPETIEALARVDKALNTRKNSTPMIPNGAFCDNCDLLRDGICQTLPYCGKCTDANENL